MFDLIGYLQLHKAMNILHKDAQVSDNDAIEVYTPKAISRYKRPSGYSFFLNKLDTNQSQQTINYLTINVSCLEV